MSAKTKKRSTSRAAKKAAKRSPKVPNLLGLRKTFNSLDTDGSGGVDIEELVENASLLGFGNLTAFEINELFYEADTKYVATSTTHSTVCRFVVFEGVLTHFLSLSLPQRRRHHGLCRVQRHRHFGAGYFLQVEKRGRAGERNETLQQRSGGLGRCVSSSAKNGVQFVRIFLFFSQIKREKKP
jgi:hypothetical protein